MSTQPYLYVDNLCMRFPSGKKTEELTVFDEVTFGVAKGEFASIIGHSGCGKSTILNAIAGLSTPTSGYVFVNGRSVTAPGLGRGVIFQNHSLLPWKTALANVMFSVRAKFPAWSKAEVRDHSYKYLEMVGLEDAAHRRPAQLSGGMRQRVGIARAFAIEPQILLMDEPFGALDALTRGAIQDELVAICAKTGQTVFMITHDVDEAIYLSDRILLMSNGPDARVAEQVDVSIERPRSRSQMSKLPEYYDLRANLLDFLTTRAQRKPAAACRTATEDSPEGANTNSGYRMTTPSPLITRRAAGSENA